MILKKISTKFLIMHFMENQWKMIGIEKNIIKKDNVERILKQQSKLTFNGIHKS